MYKSKIFCMRPLSLQPRVLPFAFFSDEYVSLQIAVKPFAVNASFLCNFFFWGVYTVSTHVKHVLMFVITPTFFAICLAVIFEFELALKLHA